MFRIKKSANSEKYYGTIKKTRCSDRTGLTGKERCWKYTDQSDALNLFVHDMKSHTGLLRTRLYPKYEMRIRDAASARLTPEEAEEGYGTRERWIMCCEEIIRSFGQYSREGQDKEDLCFEGYMKEGKSFRFCLPKEIPGKYFRGADLEAFTDPEATDKFRFRLKDLDAEVLFKYVLVPFYYALAKSKPENETAGEIENYYIGAAK